MTTLVQIEAYNEGIRTALRPAAGCAEAIRKDAGLQGERAGFAVAALREFSEAGEELLISAQTETEGAADAC